LCKGNGGKNCYRKNFLAPPNDQFEANRARQAMKSRKFTARIILGLSSQLVATFVFAQQVEEILANTNLAEVESQPTYMVKGEPVKLVPSDLYGAFAVSPNDLPGFEEEVAQTGALAVERSKLTDGYEIVLARRLGSATDTGFGDALAALRTNNSWYRVYGGGVSEKVLINEFIVRFSSDISDPEAQEQLKKFDAKILRKSRLTSNKYTITFPDHLPINALAKVNAMAAHRTFIFATPNFITIQPKRRLLKAAEEIYSVPDSDTEISLESNVVDWPNDDHYADDQWALKYVNADEAWEITTGACDVTVAVIDDGVDTDHEDLIHKIVGKYDAIDGDNDPEPYVDPETGTADAHGTAVAGVAAADTNNDIGIAGTSWGSNIIAVRIFDSTFSDSIPDSSAITTPEIVQEGIEKAIELGADVLNNSWKFDPTDAIGNIIEEAITEDNLVFVFAVGEATGNVEWPAKMSAYTDLIAVGASEYEAMMATSNFTAGSNEVTLVAPGVNVAATDIEGELGMSPDHYALTVFGDTSAAAPIVSGAAALLLSWYPGATPTQVRNWLEGGANESAVSGPNTNAEAYGAGLLDIKQSLINIGTTGVSLAMSVVPDEQLGFLEETKVRVEVTRNGFPLGGAMIKFGSQDETVATVSSTDPLVAADCEGVAEAVVKSASFSWVSKSTYIRAEIEGITQTVLVTTNGILLPVVVVFAAILMVALIVWISRRANSPADGDRARPG